MRLKVVKNEELDETFFEPGNREVHYGKHVAPDMHTYLYNDDDDELFDPGMTEEEYDKLGDLLSKQPVKTSDVDSPDWYVGYVMFDKEKNRERIVKYDKEEGILVAYICNPKKQITISVMKVNRFNNHKRYRNLLKRDYMREITPEDDKYNK